MSKLKENLRSIKISLVTDEDIAAIKSKVNLNEVVFLRGVNERPSGS